ncbi:MAG TPA: TldD/PmbA family protein [Rhizobiales bacterium]|nr:TldD/PmbA family protein [Hyphomicrobiales bacterium]
MADFLSQSLCDLGENLLARALKAGADAGDVVVVNGHSLSLEVRNGEVENTRQAEGIDLGLRVFCGQSQAIVSSSRFAADDLDALAARAVAMAKIAPADPFAGLPDKAQLAADFPDLDISDTAAPDSMTLKQMALECERAGLGVAGVSQSAGASASARRNKIALVNSNGFGGEYERTGYSVSASMIAGEGTGMERDYDYSASVSLSALEPAEKIGRSAGERAVRRLNPKKIASQTAPVVFEQRLAGGLIGHLSGAVLGSAVARATSFLKDDMGKKIFADGISVIDDARKRRGLASKPFDGEGVATARRTVIGDGRLESWLLDCRSARQLGLETTGHASRGTGGAPSPSSTNIYLEAGDQTPDELIAGIKNGLFVTELIGMGVNPVTGDYSRGASGFWIENGEIAWPVSEITIAGNLKDMYGGLTPANDLKFHGATNAPTCLIAEMTIAGT